MKCISHHLVLFVTSFPNYIINYINDAIVTVLNYKCKVPTSHCTHTGANDVSLDNIQYMIL